MMGVGDRKRVPPTGGNIWGCTAVAAREQPASHDAQPPRHLGEPGALLGRKVPEGRMAWGAQTCPARPPSAPGLRTTGHCAPLGHHPADLTTPVRGEVLHPPVGRRPLGPWRDDMGPRGSAGGTGPCLRQLPHDLPRGPHTRGEQPPCALTERFLRAFCRWARCQGRGGVWAFQHLPPRLCLGAEHPATRRQDTSGIAREGTPGGRCALTVWGVAVEPIAAARRCAVRGFQQAPATRPPHGPGAALQQRRHPVVKTPAGRWAGGPGRWTRGQRHPRQTVGGGQSAGADPGAGPLAGPCGRVPESDCANGQRYGGHRSAPAPPEEATGGPLPRPSGATANAQRGPVGGHGHARSMRQRCGASAAQLTWGA